MRHGRSPFQAALEAAGLQEARFEAQLAATSVAVSARFEAGGRRYVVRQDRSGAQSLGLDRAREVMLMAAAADQGLAPETVFHDAEMGVLVRRHVPGHSWQQAPGEVDWAAVGAVLRRVHELPMPAVAPLDIAHCGTRYAVLTGGGDALRFAQTLGERAAALMADGINCTCHNDAHLGNLIGPVGDAAAVQMIDWEYAAPGHPLFDLAVVAGYHQLDERARKSLVAGWAGDAPLVDPVALVDFIDLYDGLSSLWSQAVSKLELDHPRQGRQAERY
ncbi:MAG: phosphotransferase [Pseudomonadota bacterium]